MDFDGLGCCPTFGRCCHVHAVARPKWYLHYAISHVKIWGPTQVQGLCLKVMFVMAKAKVSKIKVLHNLILNSTLSPTIKISFKVN